ncbi:MAG TPA: protein kinase [Polyangiales bacterium]|nr:protein kinase [Polyangiales bacterium]
MLICPKCRTTFSSSSAPTCYRDGEKLVDYERFVADERDPLRNKLIGDKYQLLERVGQGGMGTIYRATQSGLNRQVAVKILKRELNVDPDTVARFHREAHAMSLLTHANTVRVYDFGQTDDGLLYLVMELLVGELLTTRMDRAPLDVIDAVRMTQQILRSLGEAHRKALVHRDLKPDNVFLVRAEGHPEPVIKVLDFGIAKIVAPDRRVDQFETQAGTVFGTPRYMSPEQAQGGALDGRSDLYSVGALLYQMLTGRAPFVEDDAVVVMAKHIQQRPEPPIKLRPDRPIPQRLDDVVMKAMAKDPASRYQEAGEFVQALEACADEVVRAQRAVFTGAWKRRRSRWLPYAALAGVLFGAGYFGVRAYAKLHTPADVKSTQLAEPVAPPPAPELAPASEPEPEPRPVAVEPEAPREEPRGGRRSRARRARAHEGARPPEVKPETEPAAKPAAGEAYERFE